MKPIDLIVTQIIMKANGNVRSTYNLFTLYITFLQVRTIFIQTMLWLDGGRGGGGW